MFQKNIKRIIKTDQMSTGIPHHCDFNEGLDGEMEVNEMDEEAAAMALLVAPSPVFWSRADFMIQLVRWVHYYSFFALFVLVTGA
jgi:hypothetical protein